MAGLPAEKQMKIQWFRSTDDGLERNDKKEKNINKMMSRGVETKHFLQNLQGPKPSSSGK